MKHLFASLLFAILLTGCSIPVYHNTIMDREPLELEDYNEVYDTRKELVELVNMLSFIGVLGEEETSDLDFLDDIVYRHWLAIQIAIVEREQDRFDYHLEEMLEVTTEMAEFLYELLSEEQKINMKEFFNKEEI